MKHTIIFIHYEFINNSFHAMIQGFSIMTRKEYILLQLSCLLPSNIRRCAAETSREAKEHSGTRGQHCSAALRG